LAPDGDGSWGDPDEIDGGLQGAFARFAVDPSHVAVVGFSAGASDALSLGLANGDLFTHVVAHSPGDYSGNGTVGQPEVFVAHGTDERPEDPVEFARARYEAGESNLFASPGSFAARVCAAR
jgi:predicted esterase